MRILCSELCTACDLALLDLPRCDGFGPRDAEVAVVGINPSIRSHRRTVGAFNVPLYAGEQAIGRLSEVKKSGADRAFVAIAEGVGLDLSRVYSTNVVKCATPGNREPTPEEVRTCERRYLRRELEALPNLRAVLVFGRVAGSALGLSDFGETATIEGTIAEGILLRHPVATLRRWTRLPTEIRNVSEFLWTWARSSTREGSEPAAL